MHAIVADAPSQFHLHAALTGVSSVWQASHYGEEGVQQHNSELADLPLGRTRGGHLHGGP